MSTTKIKFIDPISTPVTNNSVIAEGDRIDTALFKLQSQISAGGGGGGGVTLNKGSATIQFSADHLGSNEAQVTVTGQTGITSTSQIRVYVDADDTSADHSASDHKYLGLFAAFSAGGIVGGTSFTIYARSIQKLTGAFTVRWIWS